MTQEAKVLRVLHGSEGAIDPGTVVDVTKWPKSNINALIECGQIKLITDDSVDVQGYIDRIDELESMLKKHDLMFDPDIHVSEESKKTDGTYRRKPVKKAEGK